MIASCQELVWAHHILSHLGMDDHTYTHLSIRSSAGNSYYLNAFGMRFEEACLDSLVHVSLDGEVLSDNEKIYNPTAYHTHGTIYKHRKDVNAIFHMHTPEIVAVSCQPEGLLMASQWALHFYNQIAYHDYNSLIVKSEQGLKLVDDLGMHKILLMRHHGALIAGSTIYEAMFFSYHLQQACKTQCLLKCNHLTLDESLIKSANYDLLRFEKNIGKRDWDAWLRMLCQKKS